MNTEPSSDLSGGPVGVPTRQPSDGHRGARGVRATARRALRWGSFSTVNDWLSALTIALFYAVVVVAGVVLRSQFLMMFGGVLALTWLVRAGVLLRRERERRSREDA